MAPLTKEPEVLATADATTTRPAAQPAKPAAPAAPGVRADAVSVEVPVRVYGSRITQVPGQAEPNSEPFEEQTSTMIVFPQGAVLRMSTVVGVGQMLVVTNTKTKADAICRVVKVRTFSNTQGYVEVEFTTSQKNYWGVRFPSEGPAPVAPAPAAPVASAPVAAVPPPAPVAQKPAEPVKAAAPVVPVAPVVPAPVAVTPAIVPPPPPKPVAPAAPVAVVPPVTPVAPKVATPAPVAVAPVAPAAPVVEDEDLDTVLSRLTPSAPAPVAASPVTAAPSLDAVFTSKPEETVEAKPSAPVVVEPVKPAAAIEFPAAPPPAPVPSLTLSELRGDAIAEPANSSEDTEVIEQASILKHAAAESEAAAPRRSTGSFSGGLSLTGGTLISTSSPGVEAPVADSLPSEASSSIGGDYSAPAKKSNFLLIAACLGALVVVAGGGAFYFRTSLAGSKAAAPSADVQTSKPAEAEPAGETSEQSVLRNTVAANKAPAQPAAATPVAIPEPVHNAPAQPSASNDSGVTVTPSVSHARQQKAIENVVDATSNAHPVAAQRADADAPGAAPALDGAGGGSGNGNALTGLVAGNDGSSLKAPELKQEGPVRVGGNVKEPQLLSHVMPQYPLTAKEAGIQGDVVVQTTVDEHGNVVNMKVVSGPMMLRQPALEALKRWKYAPSTLNGQPISVSMSVTIKFNNR